jgi:hypothetical protein
MYADSLGGSLLVFMVITMTVGTVLGFAGLALRDKFYSAKRRRERESLAAVVPPAANDRTDALAA